MTYHDLYQHEKSVVATTVATLLLVILLQFLLVVGVL